ncbi:unnamed protein product [Owenia fusiformis]|uniref:Uncharacterized protein n=1 Tax=Owenia fusiformis TaxID=6347 RepID=A0A8J1UQC0_OWEFU|nr:unnamed protein product [Owenia fusiformis]
MATAYDAIDRSKRKADCENSASKVGKKTCVKKSQFNMGDNIPARMNAEPNAMCSKDSDNAVLSLLTKLVADHLKISDKLDSMQTDMIQREERIMAKIDVKLENTKDIMKQEITKVNQNLQSQIDSVSEDMNNLKDSINLCKIVKNIPQSENEDCIAKVNEFLNVGVKTKAKVKRA